MTFGNFEFAVLMAMLVVAVLIGRSIWLGRRRWEPAEWAREMGVELTPRNEAFLRSYIARTRIMRVGGGLIGFFGPAVYSALAGEPPPWPVDFSLLDALAGYLVGAVLAEVTVKRPTAKIPAASLVPRDLGGYLPPRLSTALRVSAAVALVLVPLYSVLPRRESLAGLDGLPPAVILVPTILVILVGVELSQRYIVARSRPLVESDLVQADDAVRSASLHALAGAGIALELLIVSVELLGSATVSDIQLLRWTLPWIALVCFVSSLWSWMHVTRPHKWHDWRTGQGAHA
ncbi:MAG: hypothetical protein ABR529_12780 [Actinomycetota bacterium]